MILSKTPFRISFVGGGTDFPDFYRKESGGVISTTINKYVYIVVHPSFNEKIRLQYSVFEEVENVEDVKNSRIRECMKLTGVDKGIEIHSLAEAPTKVGLGGSSSFTVGLLNALYAYKGEIVSPEKLAQDACKVEIDILKEPIGKQDQYIAAYGGLRHIQFNRDDSVSVGPVTLNEEIIKRLEENLLLFYTGISRDASSVLVEQKENIEKTESFSHLLELNNLRQELKSELHANRLSKFGEILHKGWELKKRLASKITNPALDKYY